MPEVSPPEPKYMVVDFLLRRHPKWNVEMGCQNLWPVASKSKSAQIRKIYLDRILYFACVAQGQ